MILAVNEFILLRILLATFPVFLVLLIFRIIYKGKSPVLKKFRPIYIIAFLIILDLIIYHMVWFIVNMPTNNDIDKITSSLCKSTHIKIYHRLPSNGNRDEEEIVFNDKDKINALIQRVKEKKYCRMLEKAPMSTFEFFPISVYLEETLLCSFVITCDNGVLATDELCNNRWYIYRGNLFSETKNIFFKDLEYGF